MEGEGTQVFIFGFPVKDVKRKGGLSGSGNSGYHDQFVPGNFKADGMKVVFGSIPDDNRIVPVRFFQAVQVQAGIRI